MPGGWALPDLSPAGPDPPLSPRTGPPTGGGRRRPRREPRPRRRRHGAARWNGRGHGDGALPV